MPCVTITPLLMLCLEFDVLLRSSEIQFPGIPRSAPLILGFLLPDLPLLSTFAYFPYLFFFADGFRAQLKLSPPHFKLS